MNDLISRQIAQKLFGKALTYQEQQGKLTWTTSEVKQWIADFIEDLPSAQPKWMKTKWKPVEVDSDDNVWLWECENCHEETEFKWDFCPVCGCEMKNATKVKG